MFIFADQAAYADILLQKESDPTLQDLAVEKIEGVKDVLEKLTVLPPEADVIVFLDGQGYKGNNATVAAKIATENNLL